VTTQEQLDEAILSAKISRKELADAIYLKNYAQRADKDMTRASGRGESYEVAMKRTLAQSRLTTRASILTDLYCLKAHIHTQYSKTGKVYLHLPDPAEQLQKAIYGIWCIERSRKDALAPA